MTKRLSSQEVGDCARDLRIPQDVESENKHYTSVLARTENDDRFAAFPPPPLLSPFKPRPCPPHSPTSSSADPPNWPLKSRDHLKSHHTQGYDSPPDTPPGGHTFLLEASPLYKRTTDDGPPRAWPGAPGWGPLQTPSQRNGGVSRDELQASATPMPRDCHSRSLSLGQRLATRSSMPSTFDQARSSTLLEPLPRLRSTSLGQRLTYPPPRTSSLTNRSIHKSTGSRDLRQRAISGTSQIPAWVEKVLAASKADLSEASAQGAEVGDSEKNGCTIKEATIVPVTASPTKPKVIVIPSRHSSATWPSVDRTSKQLDGSGPMPHVWLAKKPGFRERSSTRRQQPQRQTKSLPTTACRARSISPVVPWSDRASRLSLRSPLPQGPELSSRRMNLHHLVGHAKSENIHPSAQHSGSQSSPIGRVFSELETAVFTQTMTPLSLSSPPIQKIRLAQRSKPSSYSRVPCSRYSPFNPLAQHPTHPTPNDASQTPIDPRSPRNETLPATLHIIFPNATITQLSDLTATFIALNYLASSPPLAKPCCTTTFPPRSSKMGVMSSLQQPPCDYIPPKARGILGIDQGSLTVTSPLASSSSSSSPATARPKMSSTYRGVTSAMDPTPLTNGEEDGDGSPSYTTTMTRIEDLKTGLRILARAQIRDAQQPQQSAGCKNGKVVDEGLMRAVGVVVGMVEDGRRGYMV